MQRKTTLYAIRDIIARDIIGPIHHFRHEAPAIRLFTDVAARQGTAINEHPGDYELIRLGHIDEEDDGHTLTITADFHVVLTGSQWLAAQSKAPTTSPTEH